jgi:hypothetical protein
MSANPAMDGKYWGAAAFSIGRRATATKRPIIAYHVTVFIDLFILLINSKNKVQAILMEEEEPHSLPHDRQVPSLHKSHLYTSNGHHMVYQHHSVEGLIRTLQKDDHLP